VRQAGDTLHGSVETLARRLLISEVTSGMSMRKYVLITPARNEGDFIEDTIQSVISQTLLPEKWIIVSDGSTDRTDEVVEKYLSSHFWMDLLRMPEHGERHFGSKARCFNAGYEKVRGLKYDVIGNLDADITFEPDYFEFLLDRFRESPELGVAGTPFVEESFKYDYRFTNIEHVSGACQLFRRECFEDVGGYIPIKGGGIDWTAVTTARMKGWRTRTFTEKTCLHHRKIGSYKSGVFRTNFKVGEKDYVLGNHPLWQCFRAFYQMTKRPLFLGGLSLFLGYAWAAVKGVERPISAQLIQYSRREQMTRLKKILSKGKNGRNTETVA
jgi:poly-beta-1,6-N-acetyl-D-glucosamine synthase